MSDYSIICGDCREVMAEMEAESVDAIVTDPPYGLEFMGKEWDRLWRDASSETIRSAGRTAAQFKTDTPRYEAGPAAQAWHESWAREAYRVLKPGGHLLAFGGSRTYHRMACAVEDAGFEIRDQIQYLYGSGFPKSHSVSKAFDKAAGAERKIVGSKHVTRILDEDTLRRDNYTVGAVAHGGLIDITAPATDLARQWDGWGTALKPAHEPIVVARKPLIGTVAANVERYGVGALNIDGCRVATDDNLNGGGYTPRSRGNAWQETGGMNSAGRCAGGPFVQPSGRWPANVVLDEEAGRMLDEETGELSSHPGQYKNDSKGSWFGANQKRGQVVSTGDRGGPSRFFYCAKASRKERERGLNGDRCGHPTVKPVALMRWLVRLVTPPGGLVLDPFAGSGTTGIACVLEGFEFMGIEQDAEYAEIAEKRIAAVEPDLFAANSA